MKHFAVIKKRKKNLKLPKKGSNLLYPHQPYYKYKSIAQVALARLVFTLLILSISSSALYAEIKLSNPLAKDVGQAYGFYLGQKYSLNEISKKYPSISTQALIAENEFMATFNSSIEGMDSLMTKQSSVEWNVIKRQLSKQITQTIDIDQITESQARQFIQIVRERAKGNIESPIIQTLLLFKAGYETNPEREFIDGYKYKYFTNGIGKAKGVEFSIEYPKTWAANEGDRPNIVQKFVSENGRGLEILLILIKELPLPEGEKITEREVMEILNPKDLQEFIPAGGVYVSSGKLTLENLPGFWLHFKTKMERVRNSLEMEVIMYTIYYKNKLIQIQGQVLTSVNGEPLDRGGLTKFEKLFDLMANTLVISNLYK